MSGIQGVSSNEQVVNTGARYTGLANMLVVGINPTMEEMKAKGQNPQQEPKYVTNEFVDAKEVDGPEGKITIPAYNYSKNRLDFQLYHPTAKFYAKLAIWLEDRVRWNQKHTKVEWINKFGFTAWTLDDQILEGSQLEKAPAYSWWSTEGARPALNGEGKLSLFLQAWANIPKEKQGTLDNPSALAKGDYTEIKGLHAAISKNEVKVLNGVKKVEKDGKVSYYQAVYDGFFDRAYINNFENWKKALLNEYGKFEADYQNDLNFKKYEGDSRLQGDAPTNLDLPQGAQQEQGAPKFSF
jgi:hypothetical protein